MSQLNQMQQFLAWHASLRQATTGIMATCVRVGVGKVTLPVTLGSQMLRVSDRQGNTKVERTDRDLIFGANLFTFDSGVTIAQPQDGDQWYLDVQDGNGLGRFDAMPYNREPSWRYSDPFRTIARVHTKFISDDVDPNQPTGLSAEVVGSTIVLAWLPQSDATTFNVYRSTISGEETLLAEGVEGLGFVDDSAINRTTYYYTLAAVNFFGTSEQSIEVSEEALFPPTTPAGLAAFGGIGGAFVEWNEVAFADTYDVESSADDSTWSMVSPAQAGTSYADSTGNGYYRIRATNGQGSSAWTPGAAAGSPLSNTITWLRSVHGFTTSRWSDQSGHGTDATQATTGNQFQVHSNGLGGKPTVRAVDANRSMDFGNVMPAQSTFTKVVLFKTSAEGGANNLLSGTSSPNGHTLNLSGESLTSVIFTSAGINQVLASSIGVGSPQTNWALGVLVANETIAPATPGVNQSYNEAVYINNVCGGISPYPQNLAVTNGTFTVGGIQGAAGFGFIGDLAEVFLTSKSPTPLEMNHLASLCNATYGLSIPLFTQAVLFLGDSITNGALASPAGGSWASYIASNLPAKYYLNQGQSSGTCADLLTLAPTGIYPYISPAVPTTVVLMVGTNDIDFAGFTPSQVYDNATTLIRAAKAAGAVRAVAVTMLPRGTADEANRQILCNLFVNDANGLFDAVADVRTLAMGAPGANASLVYFAADQIHPNDSGHAELFRLIAPLIDPAAVIPPPGPIDLIITQSSGNLVLNWTASAGATGYDVQSAPAIFGPFTTISSNQAGSTFTDTNAAATAAMGTTGQAYYRIRAQVSGTPSLWTANGANSVFPVFDTFVDMNGTALTAHTMPDGNGWIMGPCDQPAVIENNQATFAHSALFTTNIAITQCHLSDGTVQLTGLLANLGGDGYTLSLIFRYTDATNFWSAFLAGASHPLAGFNLYKIVAGVATKVSNSATVPTDGVNHAVKAVLNGTSISVSYDGNSPLIATDSFNDTATLHGFEHQTPNEAASQFFMHP